MKITLNHKNSLTESGLTKSGSLLWELNYLTSEPN